MTKEPPYIIKHIQLDQQAEQTMLSMPQQQNYYLVFWWKNVPLGELYLNEKDELSEQDIYQKIYDSIQPAINAYAAEQKENTESLKTLFRQNNFQTFSTKINHFLKSFFPTNPSSEVDITVIICTSNRSSHLQQCLEALIKQTAIPKEIIVVDNAPKDDSTYQLTKQFKNVVYCKEQEAGLSKARNVGIRKAKASIIAWTDDDVLVDKFWTYRIWQTFQNKEVAAMTGLVIAAELETKSQQLFEKYWSFNRGYLQKTFNSEYFKKALSLGPKVWEIGAGANMAFKKEIFKAVGYFDERLGAGASGCNEDSEFWFRILASGHTIQYNPLAVVYHKHRKDLKALNRQIYSYMRGFTTAALIQQAQVNDAAYKKILFIKLPKQYIKRLAKHVRKKLPLNTTLFSEVKGLISGIIFYYNNKSRPSITKTVHHEQ